MAEGESMVLRYLLRNRAGKHNRKGMNTRWYCWRADQRLIFCSTA